MLNTAAVKKALMRVKLMAYFQQVSSTVSDSPNNALTRTTATDWRTTPSACAALNDWLFDEGSLTQRLSQLCRGNFRVQVLAEGWQTLPDDECQTLNIPSQSCGWVREVFLCDEQRPWVFARSVASQAQLQASDFDLSQLGSRSLGQLLFSHQAFQRGAMYIRQMPCQHLPAVAQQQAATQQYLWARRSCFHKNSLGVLVAEVFLPRLWQDINTSAFNNL